MHTQQLAILNICIHIYTPHLLCRTHLWLKMYRDEEHLCLGLALADICSYGSLLKSNHQIFVFTMKMLSSPPPFTFLPNFTYAGKYLIHEAVSLDSVRKVNVTAERCVSSILTVWSTANNLTNLMCADIVTDDLCAGGPPECGP